MWDEVAERIREVAREESTQLERYRVARAEPLLLDEVDGETRLEEGDPDFVVTDTVREHRERYGLEADTGMIVLRHGNEWFTLGVESDEEVGTGGAGGGTGTRAFAFFIGG